MRLLVIIVTRSASVTLRLTAQLRNEGSAYSGAISKMNNRSRCAAAEEAEQSLL